MRTLVIAWICLLASGCSDSKVANKDIVSESTLVPASRYPTAVDPSKVGSYPALTKSGGGYFYDDVLEYRVWIYPKGGGDDYYRAFPSYESALKFSKSVSTAEK